MYGTLSRLRAGMGQEQTLLDHLFRWEQEFLPAVSGYVAGYLFQPAAAPGQILRILVFESPTSYRTYRDDPAQARWEQALLALLEQAPEWHDGEFSDLVAEFRGL